MERRLAPGPGRKRREVTLSDEKSKKGLGELYEEEFLKVGATSDAIGMPHRVPQRMPCVC